MNTFSLRLVACDRLFYDGECEIVVFPGYDGEMAVMANHEGMTTLIEVGEIRFRTPDGEWHEVVVSDGIVNVQRNHVAIIVYSAEKPEEIDAFRAEAALERAKEQLRHKQSIMEYHVSAASMARARVRLKYAGKSDINI